LLAAEASDGSAELLSLLTNFGWQSKRFQRKLLWMNFGSKILAMEKLPQWRDQWRRQGRKLVATNGCFDILHLGHVTYLQAARNLGDALIVGLTSDTEVQKLKGEGRPVNNEQDRAALLAALESVSAVCLFREPDARKFLSVCHPDIYVKGGDYTIDTINQDERRYLEGLGVQIVILPGVADKSTTGLLKKLMNL
jgi:D-glycero-beta-D-manno-heptose 1-phosphate adenylyltransferase